MNKLFWLVAALSAFMLLLFAVTGCAANQGNQGGQGGGSDAAGSGGAQTADSQPVVSEFHWVIYTVDIANVEDNASAAGVNDVSGRLVKVTFDYVSDTEGHGGFYYGQDKEMFDNLAGSEISLADSTGATYANNGAFGNIAMADPTDITKGVKEVQQEFALFFDVPTNVSIDDLSLVVEGQTLPIGSFVAS